LNGILAGPGVDLSEPGSKGNVSVMESTTLALPEVFRASGAGPDERGRLDVTLARVAELYQSLELGRRDIDPVAVLSQLSVDFALHFALEEGSGYFGAALRERPGLSHDIAELHREHAVLLDELDTVRAVAADERRSSELASAILRLVTDLRAHESKEVALLQELVLRDEGVGAD
jgi:hypothetical protein